MISVAVDVGGTFTDVVAVNSETGELDVVKVPTSTARLADGVLEGTRDVLERAGAKPQDVTRFVHGTTVGTNAVLERRGATVGLLMTEGFEDVLEIGRTRRRILYDLNIDRQTPTFVAPRRRRLGVRERIGADGDVVVALDETQALTAVDALLAAGVDAIAVCFLHAYRNDAHELRVRELVHERVPSLSVSLSSEVDPLFREYERAVVTCFDAYLGPAVRSYLAELEARLEEAGVVCPLQVMQSRGGLASAEHAARRPVTLLLSGPAAGVVGANVAARRSGIADVATLDVGGTSADVALVHDGRPAVTTEGGIAEFPLRIPLVDVSTIGAGGGSIAWLDKSGGLRVGPRSAGAHPGPICYRRGGTEPTVTDALLVLGHLGAGALAGGTLTLETGAARDAYATLGRSLGLEPEAAAAGVLRVATMRMVDQTRLVSVGRGHDPRRFALVALGGAGPAFAGRVAAELGIARVLIPPVPGALSALGLLSAPIEHEQAETVVVRPGDANPADLEATFERLELAVASLMSGEGASAEGVETRRSADMRYAGQSSTLEVDVGVGLSRAELERTSAAFHDRHQNVHGHAQPGKAVELVNLRVVQSWRPEEQVLELRAAEHEHRATRVAWFDGRPHDTPVVARDALAREREGPLIVEQPDTTVIVEPGHRIVPLVDGNLALVIG